MSTWTPERIEEVTRLWNEGLTTAEIGKRMGISKNAVVGKAHRLELSARPSPIKREAASRQSAPSAAPAAHRPAKIRSVPVISVGNTACKWPIGHPGEAGFTFCGEPALLTKPYCFEHYQRAYIQGKSRTDAA